MKNKLIHFGNRLLIIIATLMLVTLVACTSSPTTTPSPTPSSSPTRIQSYPQTYTSAAFLHV
jgi:hypothetical protein